MTEVLYRIEVEAQSEEAANELRMRIEDDLKLTLTAFEANEEQ